MERRRLNEARLFLRELSDNPPRLPYEPDLLPRLFACTKDSSKASIDDLTRLIEGSPKLASRVLAIANSAVYALEGSISSLKRAVSVLGFREVRLLVVMVGAVAAIKGAKMPKDFDVMGLWRHQLRTAAVGRELSAAMSAEAKAGRLEKNCRPGLDPDEAYVGGLLHDIGKVFLAAARPQTWEQIEGMRLDSGLTFAEAEDAYWGMDHALIGAQVLHFWKLPLLLTDPINWHHAPALAPALQREAMLMAAANLIAHYTEADQGALPEEADKLLPAGLDRACLAEPLKSALEHDHSEMIMGLVA
jgi:HD-like signal output (HDOD) protein